MSTQNKKALEIMLSDAAKKQELINKVAHIVGNKQMAALAVSMYGDDALEVVIDLNKQGLLI